MAVGRPISDQTFQRILPRRATHHPFTAPIHRSHQWLSLGRATSVRPGAFFFDGKVWPSASPVWQPGRSPRSFFLCIHLDKGNHFSIWTFEPRKPLLAACITFYWSVLATPLFDIIGLICLHPFGVQVLLDCVFRCFKPYRMLPILHRPIFSIYLASKNLLCLSIVCPI